MGCCPAAYGCAWVLPQQLACKRLSMRRLHNHCGEFRCCTSRDAWKARTLVSYWTLACLARKVVGIGLQHLSLSSKSCPVRGPEKPNKTHHAVLPPEPRNKRALSVLVVWSSTRRRRRADGRRRRRITARTTTGLPRETSPTRRAGAGHHTRKRVRNTKRNHAPRDEPAPQVLF